MLSNPLHRISRFKRATNDKFFLMICENDSKFDRGSTESQLNEWGAVAIEECRQDLTDNQLPELATTGGVDGCDLDVATARRDFPLHGHDKSRSATALYA